jgi:16S rRNA U516 pseudouridylate synthase RsuA-like enzyme
VVADNKRYRAEITAKATGMMLSQTQAGIAANAVILSARSIITNPKLYQVITAQTRQVNAQTRRVATCFIRSGRYREITSMLM